jgi:hypothetical protein
MKPKYLDKYNCHALLPMGHGLPMLQRLDNCLCQINDMPGKYRGLIDKLIEHNKSTINKRRGSERLLNNQIDIAQGLYVVEKEIKTEVRDRPYPGPAQLHTVVEYEGGTAWKTLVPLQYLLKGWGDANSGHQCYVHSISKNVPRIGSVDQLLSRQMSDEDTHYYVGITSRNWLERLGEHIAETRRGSRRSFYQALRESSGWQGVLYTSSLREINQGYEEAMNWEELHVDKIAADQYGLNMIPGGFKGLRHLHKFGITRKVRVSLEERDRAISEYARQNPRKGIPNPFIKAWWEDDEHYEQVNEANPKRLSVDQRKEIRRLHDKGVSISKITKHVGALDERQVKDFLSGKTYKRGAV